MHFDFEALLNVAIKSSHGASRVVRCKKKEGNFDRAFIMKLDNGAKVVARLPNGFAGHPRLTLASEVATLQYGNSCPKACFEDTKLLTVLYSQRKDKCACPESPGLECGSRNQFCWS